MKKKIVSESHNNKDESQDSADVSEQADSPSKAALEKLRNEEKRFHALTEHSPDIIAIVNLEGIITYINPAVEKALGFKAEERIGARGFELVHSDDLKFLSDSFNTLAADANAPAIYGEMRLRHKDGSWRTFEAVGSNLVNNNVVEAVIVNYRDITERKRTEEKLRDEEQRFRALTEQSSDIILLVNRKGMIIYENKTVDKVLGYKPEERIGASSFENIHPDDLQSNVNEFNKIFKDTKAPVFRTEIRLHHKDGSWRTFEEMASGLSRDNKVESAIINLRDISDRKRFEEALRKSELMFRNLFENSPVGIFLLQNRVFVEVNPALCSITGYLPEELIGRPVSIGYADHEEYERVGKIIYEQVAKNGTGFIEARMKRKNGKIFNGLLYLNPIDPQDSSFGYQGIMIDITERKITEEALKQSETNYRNIFENAMEGIYQSTMEGSFITVNAAFARMAGYDSPAELIKSVQDIGTQLYVHSEDRKRFLEIREEKGFVEKFETEFYRKDGSAFWVVINARVVKDEQKGSLYTEGLIEDITLRKQAEEKLYQSLDSLKKAINATVQVLVFASEARDPYTAGHQARSAHLACAIAAEMGLPEEKIDGIRMVGIIHDIGKLSIPAEILTKPTKLTNLEFSLIKEHARSGFEMLKDVESPWPLAEIVYQHHERMNGSGYPRSLKEDEILIEARILAVADVVEAMASHRPYRASLGMEAALQEIEKNKGILYDDGVVNACLRLFREKGYQLT